MAQRRMLSFPIRLEDDGRLASVVVDSTAGRAQRIAQLVGTVVGERFMAASFGIADPAWRGLNLAEIKHKVAMHGPFDVQLSSVQTWDDDLTQKVTIRFSEVEP